MNSDGKRPRITLRRRAMILLKAFTRGIIKFIIIIILLPIWIIPLILFFIITMFAMMGDEDYDPTVPDWILNLIEKLIGW